LLLPLDELKNRQEIVHTERNVNGVAVHRKDGSTISSGIYAVPTVLITVRTASFKIDSTISLQFMEKVIVLRGENLNHFLKRNVGELLIMRAVQNKMDLNPANAIIITHVNLLGFGPLKRTI
jgi:hypothetical protein|tara:strand:+ start:443 stop:808 length:366 start_codon:yes stop_codon:yes gene_type:complete